MAKPSPRQVFDDPAAHWAFLTQPTDDDFEGQHFDRKEVGRLEADGTISRKSLDGIRELVRKTLSAFANSNKEGGLLVLGISSTGEVMGIDHLSETQQNDICDQNTSLHHHAADVRLLDCSNARGDDKIICLMYSGWATTGICEIMGNSPKAWTRNGAQCVTVTQQVRDSIRIRKGLVDVEVNPFCEYDPDDVDKDVLAEFRKVFQPGASTEFDDERLLKEAGAIVKKNGEYWFTLPGVLFFSSNPQRVAAHAYIRLMRFGVVSADFRNRGTPTLNREFKGPITSQIRSARTYFRDSGFFKRFQKRNADGGFIEEPELPPVAIDEAIVNAVAHRDYFTKLPTECEAYLDAFIVKNPGRVIQRNVDLPDHFRLDTTHLDSTPRNAKLLEWLKLMQDPDGKAFVQAVSEGTKRMNQEMVSLKLSPPEFHLAENESLLKLQSNAQQREAAILAATVSVSTETINFYPIAVRKGADPVDANEFRNRQGEFSSTLRDALDAKGWYIDRFSFGRITVHRRGNALPIAEKARAYVGLYPAYSIQILEAFGRHYLCIDYRCEVLNLKKLNYVLGRLEKSDVTDISCVANADGWRKGRIVEINDDWTKIRFYDTEQEQAVPTSDVIPILRVRSIEAMLRADNVCVDLNSAIKRASLASEIAAARLRAEKIQQCANMLASAVFPVAFGEYEVSLENTSVHLVEQRRPGQVALSVHRLSEPEVEFRGHNSTPDVRDGITKFGSFDHDAHQVEIVPVCVTAFKDQMGSLIRRLMEGKFKYKGAERTFSTKFSYTTVVTATSVRDIETEIDRLLKQNPDWCGNTKLNRLFLVQSPEEGFASDDELSPYYVAKRRLLEAGVPCQMVDTPTLSHPDWKDLNLALNVIAKCGVTPWVLPERIPDADFFIGLSYTQSRGGQRIMGFANVFNNYGRWVFYAGNTTTFESSKRSDHLASLVKKTLERLRQVHSLPTSSNLVIHHSVRISREDRTAILRAARSVVPEVSLTFVWINSHGNTRLFDTRPETDGSARRGSYVSLSRRTVLLSTTGTNPYRKAMGTPRPLELSVMHFDARKDEPSDYDRRSLALQVLSLTKLNWASTDAFCGEPITVKYASDIAYLTAAFLRQREPFTLHTALESTPWFI